ncbi:ribonuclease HII [Desulfovibrio psychrotolerans]|uniref:Ribonuclease HII n=1 Tax=Desulfovibrio psychrotolerans TaxID=415242 RepID=A0A7J0BT73_9BACT|nr:ribonuclease HII [Desulfovibrio psychrotolerans]GFM36916.1 ribonuclease HII [Desulfovibrio psychrotolerans]
MAPRKRPTALSLSLLEGHDDIPWQGWPTPFAGVDEAGRGCLAGPVVAGACILPPDHTLEGLTDSKKLTEARREALYPLIRQQALAWGLGIAWPAEIDRVNILQATFLAMHRAICALRVPPAFLAVDGNHAIPDHLACSFRFRGDSGQQQTAQLAVQKAVPQAAIIKGDLRVPAISAASIIAKTFRDRLMHSLDRRYPAYGFAGHKGYGTQDHIATIVQHGPCRMHRLTFAKVRPEPSGTQISQGMLADCWQAASPQAVTK